jgi:hypothetical protein
MEFSRSIESLHMQPYLLTIPIRGTLLSPHSPCHVRLTPRTAQISALSLSFRQNNATVTLRKRSRVLLSPALGGPEGSSDDDVVGQGNGVGPEGIAEDPVLHDLILGMGSSGEFGGQKPTGAPGTKVA